MTPMPLRCCRLLLFSPLDLMCRRAAAAAIFFSADIYYAMPAAMLRCAPMIYALRYAR